MHTAAMEVTEGKTLNQRLVNTPDIYTTEYCTAANSIHISKITILNEKANVECHTQHDTI